MSKNLPHGHHVLLTYLLSIREEFHDVPENEIESNWDQVVDKWVANSL